MNTKKILIADDDKQLVDVLSRRCQSLGLEVIEAHDALSALNLVYTCAPHVLCLDEKMPPGDGLSVCEMLRKDEARSSLPVIILTGEKHEETIRRCYELCAYYVEKGGDTWSRVEPLLTELLYPTPTPNHATDMPAESAVPDVQTAPPSTADPAPLDPVLDAVFAALGVDENYLDEEPPAAESPLATSLDRSPWVLHVDDDREMREVMKTHLQRHGISVVNAIDGDGGVRTALRQPASAIILDYEMPNGRGDYVLRRLKDNPITKDIPVIILTGVKDKFLERRLLNMGAAAYFHKPPRYDLIVDELEKHVRIH